MPDSGDETLVVTTSHDVVKVRQLVRNRAVALGFSLVEQTKLITAASELARNMIDYGGGGRFELVTAMNGSRVGLRVSFIDEGPGISDIERALQDGFTTGRGLGLGLGGAKRLVNEFEIRSAAGAGTTIIITRWKGA
jgi:serine/threonine-protein kinase RsbT